MIGSAVAAAGGDSVVKLASSPLGTIANPLQFALSVGVVAPVAKLALPPVLPVLAEAGFQDPRVVDLSRSLVGGRAVGLVTSHVGEAVVESGRLLIGS